MLTGSLITDIRSTALSSEEQQFLCHPLIAGVILFSRNFESVEQLTELTSAIRALPRPQRLLITVDQEGGRVQRFTHGFTKIPPMGHLGQLYDDAPQSALRLAEQWGWVMASELLSVGVDLSFAPVLDLDSGLSKVIGERAFHASPEVVVLLALAFVRGMKQAGMVATGKHFPGHGSVRADSHHAVVIDSRAREFIFEGDLIPFLKGVQQNSLAAIMMAHVIYSELDPNPASFSAYWIKTVLRQEIGFKGVVLSDDLYMQGANPGLDIVDRAKMALAAGCDILLACNHPHEILEMVERLWLAGVTSDASSVCSLYAKTFLNRADLLNSDAWQQAVAEIARNL